ncbi:sorting nexin-13-like [Uloborus diversus]|uniref:sorting nexin-13-like n=1 Tax=Uloborus diversus TaxID=327109 RepID=UPI00240955C2|nr:sorting nexin-13-like [Uloborus diversus]
MASKIFWLLLVMLLSISTFGFWMCCVAVLSVALFLVGFLIILFSSPVSKVHKQFEHSIKNPQLQNRVPFEGIKKVEVLLEKPRTFSKHDQRLTGSNEIDCQIKEMLSYILRDFILSWYFKVSADEEFIMRFNEMCKKVIISFSNSSKEVNWLKFITQKVVEDFTTHLRLYRLAEAKFRKQQKEKNNMNSTIESVFFELESTLDTNICRESVCTTEESQRGYLQYICDTILFFLLPPEDLGNKIFKHFLREVLLCALLEPIIKQFADPDVINQNLIWLCKDYQINNKALLSVLRRTESEDELVAFQQIAKHELKVQNSKDSGDKDEMKKFIKSIHFIQAVANQRLERLHGISKQLDIDSAEFYLNYDTVDAPVSTSRKFISLPFDVILNNNIALDYFTQYLTGMEADGYVFFYHNVEGFRTTVEMLNDNGYDDASAESVSEKLRSLALQIFDSYLGPNATSKVNLDELLLKKLLSRIKTENITETCFEEVQEKVYEILENEFYLNGFKGSKQYIKLLAELDLLHDLTMSGDLDSLSSSKSEEEKFNCDAVVPTDEDMLNELLNAEISPSDYEFPEISSGPLSDETKEIGIIVAEVHSTGITHHAGRTFAVYAISVSHYRMEGPEEKWFVVRRYSEFYDFHELLVQKFPVLSSFNFPSKKPFNNLSRQLMEKRRYMLNDFIHFLLSHDTLAICEGLLLMVYNFLQPNVSEKGKKSFVRSVGTLVNPIKTSVRTVGNIVRLVPDTLFELKGGLIRALSRHNEVDNSCTTSDAKPITFKEPKTDDIPFRIILLLMDEVFNLRNKDLWFRRRIMALLRQIIKTMQGGSINRKIREYVQGMTSATQIAEWLKLLSKTIWPDGKLASPSPERDANTKLRTCLVTKMLLFCAIPDELKHIIGFETSFKGSMLIFNVFQHPSLNRRLIFVLIESLLTALFPHNKMADLFQKLHSQSPRRSKATSMDKANKDELLEMPKGPDSEKIGAGAQQPLRGKKGEFDSPSKETKKQKESKSKLQCLSQQSTSSPKSTKKKKKSIETAVFYTDYAEHEDTVILPLGR